MYNLIEYNNDSLETSGRLWQYYRDEPPLTNVSAIYNVPDDSASFKSNQQLIGQTKASSRKDVEIMLPLKYLSNFQRTFEIPLINCEIRK